MVSAHLSLHSYRFKKKKRKNRCCVSHIKVSAQKIVDFKCQGSIIAGERDLKKDTTWDLEKVNAAVGLSRWLCTGENIPNGLFSVYSQKFLVTNLLKEARLLS